LRLAGRKRRRRKGGGRTLAVPALVPRLVPAALAGVVAAWTAWALRFYPSGWAAGFGALAIGGVLLDTRVGVVLALAVPILPLGNYALGAAVLYTLAALALLAVSWREPRSAPLFALGPLLAPLSALGLLPLATLGLRSPLRRAVQVAAAVLTAGIVAGIRGAPLPFGAGRAPAFRAATSGNPLHVASALWQALASRPATAVEALVLTAVAILLPYARDRGPW